MHSSTTYLIPDNAFLWEEWGQSEEEERGELVWDVERLQIFLRKRHRKTKADLRPRPGIAVGQVNSFVEGGVSVGTIEEEE